MAGIYYLSPNFSCCSDQDLLNYKGMYHDTNDEKYSCPKTGAHFRFKDLCNRIEQIRI